MCKWVAQQTEEKGLLSCDTNGDLFESGVFFCWTTPSVNKMPSESDERVHETTTIYTDIYTDDSVSFRRDAKWTTAMFRMPQTNRGTAACVHRRCDREKNRSTETTTVSQRIWSLKLRSMSKKFRFGSRLQPGHRRFESGSGHNNSEFDVGKNGGDHPIDRCLSEIFVRIAMSDRKVDSSSTPRTRRTHSTFKIWTSRNCCSFAILAWKTYYSISIRTGHIDATLRRKKIDHVLKLATTCNFLLVSDNL